MKDIGKTLQTLREKEGMSRYEVGKRMQTSGRAVKTLEEDTGNPGTLTVSKYLAVFGLELKIVPK